MSNFKNRILAFAAAGLAVASVASAQTLVTISGYAAGASNIATESLTAQIPPQTVTFTGTPDTTSISFTITLNQGSIANTAIIGTTSSQVDAYGVFTCTTGCAGTKYIYGVQSGNILTFTETGLTPGTALVGGQVVVSNIRVNANAAGPAGTTLTTTIGPGTGTIVSLGGVSATQPVGVTATSLKYSFYGYPNIALCNVKTTDVNAVGVVTVSTGFALALTTDVQEVAEEAPPNVALTAPVTPVSPRIAVTFANLATGVNYYLPATVTNAGLTLVLVGSATSATPLTPTSLTATTTETNTGGATLTTAFANGPANVVGFTTATGSFTAYYDVTAASAAGNATNTPLVGANSYTFPEGTTAPLAAYTGIILYETTSSTSAGAVGAPTASVALVGGTTGYEQIAAYTPAAKAAVPYATAAITNNPATDTGILGACNTTLLFPYVLNTAGYDTGIAITNASNLGTAASGTCALTFYGTGAVTASPVTVASATVTAFTVSSVEAGFDGYMVATCTFPGAHGFAFITDGFGGGGRGLSEGYLAPVIASGGAAVTPTF